MSQRFFAATAVGLVGLLGSSVAGYAAPPTKAVPAKSVPVRLRGTVQSLTGQTLTVATASGPVRVALALNAHFAELAPSDRSQVKPGSFLGIASAEQPDGSQRAMEITIFPEALRGTGEGSYPWDVPGAAGTGGGAAAAHHSRMTNGTVAAASAPAASHSRMTNGTVAASHSRMTNGTVIPKAGSAAGGANLTLTYKGIGGAGAQPIVVPAGIPVVTIAPGTIKDVKPGAHVFVIAQRQTNGTFTSAQIMVGKNGLTPPM